MAVILEKTYRALRAANVPDDQAAEAAAELAQYENRFASLDVKVTLLTGMVGFNLALSVAILFRVFG